MTAATQRDTGAGIRRVEHCMGTVFSLDVRDVDVAVEGAVESVIAWLHRVDAIFSTYRRDSPISRLGRGETSLGDCPAEVGEVLALCAEATAVSGGYFTATPGGVLDPSGLVKGWAIERASVLLRRAGSTRHAVNGGGDLQLSGEPVPGQPWRIGIADPRNPQLLATIVSGSDLAVATSGTAERGAHVLNPHTGRPATDLASITLVGEHLTDADAYATAALAMGAGARDWVERLPDIEAFAVTPTGGTWQTRGFPAAAPVVNPGAFAPGTGTMMPTAPGPA
jgi:thiamine biosynthesis lipoprotein